MQVVADRRGQQPRPDSRAVRHSAWARLTTATPDHGSADGWTVSAVLVGDVAEPVLEAAHHDRDHRPHAGGVAVLGIAALEAALDRLGRGEGLRDAERDRGVDAHAAVGRLLHGLDPGPRGRQLDDDVRRQPVEAEGLRRPCASASRHRVGSVWIERRPARPPEASKAGMSSGAARTLISATIAHARSRSDHAGFSPARTRTRVAHMIRVAAPVVDHDRRVGGGAHRAELDRRSRARRRCSCRSRCRSAVSAIVRPSGRIGQGRLGHGLNRW